MKMDIKVDVFTLNCWGIVGVSRHRKERMTAIAAHLVESKYDFVFLQEVWNQEDYELICKKTEHVLPYSYYFYSGVVGSGVCILSQSPIVDAAQYKFSLNGYAHKILHGDWFGGKVVGLCQVNHHGLKINLYVTHLHAEYDSFHDSYLPHRISQAFEMSQFIRMTSETADLSIIGGDFNTEPSDLPYRLIIHNTGCVDSFLMQPNITNATDVSATCGHPENLYTTRNEVKDCPSGKRIDYVLYKCGTGTSVNCLSCNSTLRKIPDSSIPYSDHEAVISKLHIFKSIEAPVCQTNPQARLEALNSSRAILDACSKGLSSNRIIYLLMCSLILLVLIISSQFHVTYWLGALVTLLQVLCSLGLAFCFWMGTIMIRMEFTSLISNCKAMTVLIDAISSECDSRSSSKQSPSVPYSEINF